MSDGRTEVIRTILKAFSKAWEAKDVDALLELMTDDCVYAASIGPEPGARYCGQSEVRAGVLAMLEHDLTERSEVSNLFIVGDRAACEWRYFRRDENGHEVVTHGCDLFRFVGDKIAVKEAFRKVHAARA